MAVASPAARPEAPAAEPAAGPVLSVVVPTFNESANVPELVRRLGRALEGRAWEVVFVDDDSPDGTARLVRELAQSNPRVRVLQRIGRRGLSSACIEGMLATSAPYVAVMDADLQHDESLLAAMLATLETSDADVVVGSRYVAGGGVGAWDASRHSMSRFATRLSALVLPTPVADPMSGFFMLRRRVLDERVRALSGTGFKILLDLLTARSVPLRVVELPYTFRNRLAGESKLDSSVAWDFAMLVGDRLFGRWIPVRFVAFAGVGAVGVLVHFALLSALYKGGGIEFAWAQGAATFGAMVFNFAVNNVLTFRDRRLRGWRWFGGLATFVLACSVGALANVGIASYLFENRTQWMLAALAGIAVGAVWNYAVTKAYTWGRGARG